MHLISLNADEYEKKLEDFGEDLRNTMLATWDVSAEKVVKNTVTFNRLPRRHLEFKP